jgi:MYXO-CTERM domain-containing protein
VTDGGVTDGGVTDGGVTDGGVTDGGVTDGGVTDGGLGDGGTGDDGGFGRDAFDPQSRELESFYACGECSAGGNPIGALGPGLLVLALVMRRRRS